MQLAMTGDRMLLFDQLEDIYLDRGFFFGDGVYEVIRSYNGKIFALDHHLARFQHSLDAISITGIESEEIRTKVVDIFEKAQIDNARIYFHVTRGSAPRDHKWTDSIKPFFFMTITELPDDSELRAHGIAVSTYPDLRWKRCDIKSLNLLANVLARQDAADKGCDEAILVNEDNLITEGAGSCFFAVIDGNVQTAPLTSNILPSITRKYVFKSAAELNIPVIEQSITPDMAIAADELFMAVTTKDIVPIVKFDEKVILDGKSGKITKSLMNAFVKYTK